MVVAAMAVRLLRLLKAVHYVFPCVASQRATLEATLQSIRDSVVSAHLVPVEFDKKTAGSQWAGEKTILREKLEGERWSKQSHPWSSSRLSC
jgi:hypothetical protein